MPPAENGSQRADAALSRRALTDRVRGALASRNLTLYQAATLTRVRHPDDQRYHLPGNFYFQLRSAGLSPNLYQLFGLGRVTGYRVADWLGVFDFRLDDIPRLQVALARPRTTLLDSTTYDGEAMVPWFQERLTTTEIPGIAPLTEFLEHSEPQRISSLVSTSASPYLYAKIGRQDALAFPDLLPGSIVRADTRLAATDSRRMEGQDSRRLFLVEHERGICCCRLHFGAKNRVTLLANELPFANVELRLGTEAQILGAADYEIRSLAPQLSSGRPPLISPDIAPELVRLWTPRPLDQGQSAGAPKHALRNARLRAGLSFRQASELSQLVATALRDNRYFTSQGSLSDYEANHKLPRHIHKLLTLCIVYSLPFVTLLRSFALDLKQGGTAAIPDQWMPRRIQVSAQRPARGSDAAPSHGFLAGVRERSGEVPFFLRDSLGFLSGLSEVTLQDVFWVGGQQRALHPSLVGAQFVVVNRRRRRLLAFRLKSPWEQPLHLVMRRDGSYVLASCSLENSTIVVHPYPGSHTQAERLRDRIDGEVVGQIVAVVRSLLPSH